MRKAFTLIELMVYLGLMTITSLYAFQFLGIMQSTVDAFSRTEQQSVRIALAGDVLRRDLMCAACALQEWHASPVVFRKEILDAQHVRHHHDVWWRLKGRKLMRTQGYYDPASASWTKRSDSRVLDGVTRFTLTPRLSEDGKRVTQCRLELVCGDEQLSEIVRLRNRTVTLNLIQGLSDYR